jgi:tetratricopeptide (TPR) repeat protein
MRHRLQSLSQTSRKTLELVAVHDGALALAELVAASDLTDDSALSAIDDLQSRRIVQESDSAFSVDHELMRRVVYDDLPVPRRLDLHRRIALAIESHRPDEIEILAHHFSTARIPDKAADYLEQAASHAMTVHAYDTAARHLAQASQTLDEIDAPRARKFTVTALHEEVLDVLARRDDQEYALIRMARFASESDRGEVLRRKAWWLAHQDRVQEAASTAQEALELAEASGDNGSIVEALTALGMVACFVGQAADGVVHLERAVDYRNSNKRQVANTRNALGQNLIDLQRFDEAKSHLLAALALYEDLGDARGQAEVLGTLGTMRMERGEPDSAQIDFERAIEISERVGYRHGEAVYRMNLGILYVITNRIGAAIAAFADSLASYTAMGNSRGRALVLSNSAWLWHGLVGDDEIAADQINEALAIYETLGDERGLAQCQGLLGSILGRQGDIDSATAMFESALEKTRRLQDFWITAQALREYAATELENDAIESGIDHVLEAEALCREFGMNDLLTGVRALAGRLLLRGGRTQEALDWTSRAMRELREGVELAHLVPLALSEVHDALGNRDDASHYIAQSFEQLSAMLSDLEPAMRERSWLQVPSHREIRTRWAVIGPRKQQFDLALAEAPLGRPLRDDETVSVEWTIHDPSDVAITGKTELRAVQILRLLEESKAAGARPTVTNLSEALGVSIATIRRDIASLRASGHTIDTRGSR